MIRLARTYAAALRDEPAMRSYMLAALADDIGVAVSAWGLSLLQTDLFVDQRARATLMLPMMVSFLAGSLIAGPLADWQRGADPARLARWRWRLVVWGRVVETVALLSAMAGAAGGTPTIARLLPYFVVSAFMKTALRPARIAFEVDLLRRKQVQVDEHGAPLCDERGEPREYKVHLLTLGALTSFLRSAALFGGLLVGGQVLAAVHGNYLALFAFDVGTNLVFVAAVARGCHPDKAPRDVRLRELFGEPGARRPGGGALAAGVAELATSVRETARFLREPAQRPLCWLLLGGWVVEVVNEFYDGGMIVRHVLHGSADAVRYCQIAWKATTLLVMAALPAIARRVDRLGRIFLAAMVLDGVAIVLAGRVSALGAAGAIAPFAAALSADHALTGTSDAVISLAQNSASSAALRGRIAATYAIAVILSDMAAEALATVLAESAGIPGMLVRVGVAQLVLMVVVAALGGRRLWDFGLRGVERESLAPAPPAEATRAA